MSNLRIWDEVNQPPSSALKHIGGGRLKGMTDVNPQWRYKAMTELFGPCGIGWRYEIVEQWAVHFESGEAAAFSRVNLYVKEDEAWSEAVPGIGGSMLVAMEKSGLRVSDEAYKMATTDALSVAMKALGVAADIYAGLWDGSKYRTPEPEHRFKPGEREKIHGAVRTALENGDEAGLNEVFVEYDTPEEKLKIWSIFNSTEKAAIKAMLKGDSE